MKRKMLVALMLVVVLTYYNFLNALADGVDSVTAPPASQISSNPFFSSDSKYYSIFKIPDDLRITGEDGLQFVLIRSSISRAGSSTIAISAETKANIICMTIGGTVWIQRWINNQWTTYSSHVFRGFGASQKKTETTITVESGYYYRIVTNHIAITEQSSQYATTTVESIFVN